MDQPHCLSAVLLIAFLATSAHPQTPEGYVVALRNDFEPDVLQIIDVATGVRDTLDDGLCFGPCFSPDGMKVAYARDNRVRVCNSDGSGSPSVIDVFVDMAAQPAMNWVRIGDDDYVYWSEDSIICRAHLGTATREIVHTFSTMCGARFLGVSADGSRAATMAKPHCPGDWYVYGIEIGGIERQLARGCQGSVSPNGQYVTHNLLGHTAAEIHDFETGAVLGTITTPVGDRQFNQHRFSHASDEWVVFTVWGWQGWLCKWRENKSYEIGRCAPWDYFPGDIGAAPASMALSPSTLDFMGDSAAGTVSPASATVTVANNGGGTLAPVTVTGAPPWLAIDIDTADRNSQMLTNTIDLTAVTDGRTLVCTVTVICANASPTEAAYTVTLTTAADPVLSAVRVIPTVDTVATLGTVLFDATALDQYGDALQPQPSFIWSLTGAGTLSDGAYTAPLSRGGPYTVTASATADGATRSGSAAVYVVPSMPPITVTFPNGGELVRVGESITITWNGNCNELGGVELEISPTEGEHWLSIDATGTVSCGSAEWERYTWTVPDSIDGMSLVSGQCIVRISDYAGPSSDQSDATFSIVGADAAVSGWQGEARSTSGLRMSAGHLVVCGSAHPTTTVELFDLRGGVCRRVRVDGAGVLSGRQPSGIRIARVRHGQAYRRAIPLVTVE